MTVFLTVFLTVLFVISAFLSFGAVCKIIAAILGNTPNIPFVGKIYLAYPAMLYQITFWTLYIAHGYLLL